jgi:uncharacterized protein (TIGR04222 family)
MQDTWGIPGPTFLAYFIGATVAVAVLSAIHRKILFRGDRTARVDDLGAQQVAYLNGGDRLAVYAALGGMRAAGLIGTGPGHTLVQTGPLPGGVTPLDAAIHNAAGRQVRSRAVLEDQWVRSALDQLRDALERRGLVVGKAAVRTARMWGLAAGALVVIGVLRLIAGTQNDKPVGLLIPVLVVAVIVLILVARRGTRVATAAATKGMRDVRQRHEHLAPASSPAYATYGASGAAMGVALFGASTLYTMDPAFAADAEIQRIAASGGGTGASSACGSSSSCSSGSSCSGGSSCGGGGGCGG